MLDVECIGIVENSLEAEINLLLLLLLLVVVVQDDRAGGRD